MSTESDAGDPMVAQAMRAWTGALDAWWEMVLTDSRRLQDLSGKLGGLGAASPGGGESVSPADLAAVLEALEIVQRRLDALDDQVAVLADGMSQVVVHLQRIEEGRGGNDDP